MLGSGLCTRHHCLSDCEEEVWEADPISYFDILEPLLKYAAALIFLQNGQKKSPLSLTEAIIQICNSFPFSQTSAGLGFPGAKISNYTIREIPAVALTLPDDISTIALFRRTNRSQHTEAHPGNVFDSCTPTRFCLSFDQTRTHGSDDLTAIALTFPDNMSISAFFGRSQGDEHSESLSRKIIFAVASTGF